ncbi:MAG TPA: ABC transporter ATP-binding protein [Burkholderiales bacterium]|nr:ABC transporter ATP-binding protein [Burkholderiales bacterium]
MSAAVVELQGIRKTYNAGTPVAQEVLHGVNLTLNAGEFAALIGPSGSGKSTLLNIIGLLERGSAGSYRLGSNEMVQADDEELTRARLSTIGFVFQFHHLLPAFNALENVQMPGLMFDGAYTSARRDEALRLLEAVGLEDAVHKKPGQLSGGMQQRVAIARALALSPKLVLADEPTGNLDTHSADEIFKLMRHFNRERGTAFLIVTHDPRLAERCDRNINLVDGMIAEDKLVR